MYLIRKVSEISGVSVRTLHHYDQIGLLSPQKNENGYRYYSEEDMSLLQTILFYKYLGFSLKQIKSLLTTEDKSLLIHLKKQLTLIQNQKQKLLTLIDTLETTISSYERRIEMSTKEKFNGFRYEDNEKYKQAAIDQYGSEVIEQAIEKQKGREQEITEGFNRIFFAFAKNLSDGMPAISQENVILAKALHQHLCEYSFDCSPGVFSSIGFGYVQNDEFKQNLDRFGEGTAQYVCDAIQQYVREGQNRPTKE
ncbi:MAG: MerR family transcriptional regulator [Peptostreptococcaceae bacterium]|nr:MerR family transcriptional regulator [Peptostreptococcaceae bacterium]